jgi:hypothetical protein
MPKWEYLRWRVHDFHSNAAYLVSVNDVEVRDRAHRLAPSLERAGDEGW